MNTREIASEYRLSQWAKALEERGGSGRSIKAYCKATGIRESVCFGSFRQSGGVREVCLKQRGWIDYLIKIYLYNNNYKLKFHGTFRGT